MTQIAPCEIVLNHLIGIDTPCIRVCDVEKMLGRKRDCLYRWHRVLLRHPLYRAAGKAVREALGEKRSYPFHPFQVALLAQIDSFQYRGRNPRRNKKLSDLKDFVDRNAKFWTEENWRAGKFNPFVNKTSL